LFFTKTTFLQYFYSYKSTILFLLSFCCYKYSYSQQNYSKEIGVLSDNDLYVSSFKDRYYTNGIFVYYRFVSQKNKKITKKIIQFEIGQQMYTPHHSDSPLIEEQDRPYAGYSFINYSRHYFNKQKYSFKAALEIGILGPNSKAREFQNTIHTIYGFQKSDGWDNQIQNALGVNFNFEYLKPLSKPSHSKIDLTSSSSLKLGTIFTNITTSIYIRLNLLKKPLNSFSNSILFKSNLSLKNSKHKNELFLFIRPQIGYAIYNATIQGGLFTNNSPVTFAITPFNFETEIGIKLALKRFDLEYTRTNYTKKLKEMIDNTNTYGSIKIAYKFN